MHDEIVNVNDPDLTVPNEAYVDLGLHFDHVNHLKRFNSGMINWS